MDECERGYRYYCTHSCVNTPGSFTCACREGYVLQSGWYCSDVNECLTSSHRCDRTSGAYCRNTEGGYTCACLSGFRREGNWSCVGMQQLLLVGNTTLRLNIFFTVSVGQNEYFFLFILNFIFSFKKTFYSSKHEAPKVRTLRLTIH